MEYVKRRMQLNPLLGVTVLLVIIKPKSIDPKYRQERFL